MAITIIGNVGNQGYALPMVSAYPTDVNNQALLAWDPVNQALNYVPYVGNALGDFTVGRDLGVTRDLAVTRNATVGGILTAGPTAPLGAVIPFVTGGMTQTGTSQALTQKAVNGGNNAELTSTQLNMQGTKVVGSRDTGWTVATGTPQKTTFVTGSVTLPQLAGVVMALEQALIAHGLIGA